MVDLESFAQTIAKIDELVAAQTSRATDTGGATDTKRELVHIVLAPTHRSVLDFLIVGYVCFAIPELGWGSAVGGGPRTPLGAARPTGDGGGDVHICAADEFRRLPVLGWLAKCMGCVQSFRTFFEI